MKMKKKRVGHTPKCIQSKKWELNENFLASSEASGEMRYDCSLEGQQEKLSSSNIRPVWEWINLNRNHELEG